MTGGDGVRGRPGAIPWFARASLLKTFFNSSESSDDESSSVDMAKTPSLGTRRWLRRRLAGDGVENVAVDANGKSNVEDKGAVRGASCSKLCCHVALEYLGKLELSRTGVVGELTTVMSSQMGKSSHSARGSSVAEAWGPRR